MSADKTEPPGSASSSPDEVLCRNCGHRRDWHSRPGYCAGDALTLAGDDRNNCPCKIFWPAHLSMAGPIDLRSIPADAETAGEPEAPACPCIREGGCCHAPGVCLHGCRQAADDLTRLGQEMEATEPESRYCGEGGVCRDPLKRCGLKCRRESPQCRAQFHGGSEGYRCQLHEGHSEPHTNEIPNEGTFNWDDSVAVYPAEPAAHEHDWSEWGAVYHGGHFQWRNCACGAAQSTPEGHFCPECAPVCKAPNGCRSQSACRRSCAFSDQLKGIRMVPRPEPEAPECSHESWEVMGEHHTPEGWVKSRTCADCRADLDNIIEAEPHWPRCRDCGDNIPEGCTWCQGCVPPEAAPLRRPPYAVAYVLQDGTHFEVALPGDATVCALDGALLITHTQSPVQGLTQARPMEGA